MNFSLIVKTGLKLLLETEGGPYNQKELAEKLEIVKVLVSRSTLTNIKKQLIDELDTKKVAPATMRKVANGLQEIIYQEQGKRFNSQLGNFEFNPDPNWMAIVLKKDIPESEVSIKEPEVIFHGDGRRNISEKIALMQMADQEVIEIGIRMNTFANYFTSRRESEFQDYILKLLERGANFNCYILNPKGRIAYPYFKDRALAQPPEMEAFEAMPEIIEKLKGVKIKLNEAGFKGKFRLFRYNTFPYFNALVADRDFPHARMFISPYLYGVSRANSPVIEVHKRKNDKLYTKYWASVIAIIERAEEI